jgi:diguanylate cyclase (GGDEF)-like protein
MFMTIYNCIANQHDYMQLALAVMTLLIGSVVSARVLGMVRRDGFEESKYIWAAFAALCLGMTVWGTHFLAMIAYEVGVVSGFHIGTTMFSLLIPILGGAAATLLHGMNGPRWYSEVAGSIFGLSVVATHYVGMQGFWVSGEVAYDDLYVLISAALSMIFGAVAFSRLRRPVTRFCKYGAALALLLGIAGLHFTGMAGFSITPMDLPVPDSVLVGNESETLIALLIMAGVVLILGLSWFARHAEAQVNSRFQDRLQRLALQDSLTGVANRFQLERSYDELMQKFDFAEDGTQLAVFCVDLNGFKALNDRLGHAVGDEALVSVASRMGQAVGADGLVARTGGDEFFCLVPFNGDEGMEAVAGHIVDACSIEGETELGIYSLSASVGASCYPKHATSLSELMNKADSAMYRAKGSNNKSVVVYERAYDEAERERRKMVQELRVAIQREEFVIFYQLQTRLLDSKAIGHEALVRWQHPMRGLIGPGDFIELAEETGLIRDIGRFVLKTACRDAAACPELGQVAVNASAIQFEDDHFFHDIKETLTEYDLEPARLEIELTETAVAQNPVQAKALIRRIRELGVAVAIDDFGTGQSSLGTLKDLPFTRLKLDRAFIRELDMADSEVAREIVKAIVQMGRALGMDVLAEGVETEAQLEFLISSGCDTVQGFLLGRPAPLAVEVLENNSRALRQVEGVVAA